MDVDVREQLQELGVWLEQECGAALRGSSSRTQPGRNGGMTVDDFVARSSLVASVDSPTDSAEDDVCEACGADLPVFDLRRPDESAASPPRKRRAAVLTVAAAVLLVVGVVVIPDQDDSNVETEPVTSATTPEPVPSPTPSEPTPPPEEAGPPPSFVDSLGYRWSLVASGCCPGAAGMGDVVVGGPGLVAVGGSDRGAAVWTSVDGITWSRVPHDEEIFGGPGEQGMSSVTVGGPGLVAVGGQDWLSTDDESAVVWTSVDGLTWSRVPHDEEIFGGMGNQWMSSVTVGGPGLVAVGATGHRSDLRDDTASSPGAAAVWTSVDGITWSRVPHDEEIFGGPGEQGMSSVTVGGPGLVAVGGSDRGAVVWTSVDGITWSRVDLEEAVLGEELYVSSVTAGGPGLVAVGGDGDAVVWTSVDGITWSRVPHDEAVFGGAGDQEPGTVIAGGPGLVAIGMEGYCDDRVCPETAHGYVPVVWTSVDGLTWSRVPHDEAVFGKGDDSLRLGSVVAGGPGLVAVGRGGVIVAERLGDDAELTADN